MPPTVGRVFNMSTELWEKAEGELAKTFFISPGKLIALLEGVKLDFFQIRKNLTITKFANPFIYFSYFFLLSMP